MQPGQQQSGNEGNSRPAMRAELEQGDRGGSYALREDHGRRGVGGGVVNSCQGGRERGREMKRWREQCQEQRRGGRGGGEDARSHHLL